MSRGKSPWSWARRHKWKVSLSGACALLIVAEVALRLTPFPTALETTPPASAEFVDRNGQPLRMMLAEERRYAQRCTLEEVSPSLVAATIAAEDRRFFTHHGVDPLAVGRALWQYARGRPPASGASTITMQLVKLARPGPRTVGRKLVETWLALRVERSWSKERILTEYLNRLEYGNLQVGIASASRFYFGKPAIDLSTAESAFLAGLPKAPTRLNPHQHLAAAQSRAHWIERRMAAHNLPLPLSLPLSGSSPLRLRPPTHDFAAPHFVDLLLSRRETIPAQGGEIRTTLDLALNRFAERAIMQNLRELTGKNATAGAAVVLDNATGDVLALAGGATASYATAVNTAWMIRSPGSAMKPFTYLLALEKGRHPGTIVPDVPTDFPTSTGSYRPNNYNHRFYGPVSLRFALGNSLNVGAICALELAGGPEALQRAMIRAGVTTLDQPTDYYGLGLTLGNGEVRLLELANAYATLARLGEHRPFRLLLRDGETGTPNLRSRSAAPGVRIFDADAAYLLADMLSDNTARASSFGLYSYLRFDFPVACKTGTSSDYRDNWCIGYTPDFTVAVWVGNPDGKPMNGITGVTGAAPVMHEIFEHLHETRGTTWYKPPPAVRNYALDPLTGHRVAEHHPGAVHEKCLAPPPLATAGDYDDAGRVVLPPVYSAWVASAQNSLGSLAASASPSMSPPLTPLEILEPPAGSLFYLDPDLPLETQVIPLRAATAAPLEWTSPTLSLTTSRARLAEGRHQLTAREPATGRTASTWIEVKAL